METTNINARLPVGSWKQIAQIPVLGGAALAVCVLLLVFLSRTGLSHLMGSYLTPEFSHGILIPVIAAGIIAFRHQEIAAARHDHRWFGTALVALGIIIIGVGQISTTIHQLQYGFLISVYGLIFTYFGVSGARIVAPALVYLLFMLPPPHFVTLALTLQLQLISTQLGVAFIELFGIPVFVDGNVIDLGNYALQVAEACSGLRYLFPLLSFSFIAGYFFQAPLWQRLTVFLSAIPITILMNSFRIGMIGVLKRQFGVGATEGFAHAFEGWVVFLLSVGVLIAELYLLSAIRRAGSPLDHLGISGSYDGLRANLQRAFEDRQSVLHRWVLASLGAIVAATLTLSFIGSRPPVLPEHKPLFLLPQVTQDWRGRDVPIEASVLSILQPTDYVNRDYTHSDTLGPVNVYIAFHANQVAGRAAHSPRYCIPGGGWEIEKTEPINIAVEGPDGTSIRANRVLVSKGLQRMIVYYWHQQQGKVLTAEYEVKWNLLMRSIRTRRTDGALIRYATPLAANETEEAAEARLFELMSITQPVVNDMLPQ
ncbi:MAG: VPLPA-CTERM-specific exosortase XrtD [Pseudomonadota bacterium]